jgi:hypothetical protein
VVSDTFVKLLFSGEECKWGRHTGAGAIGDGLTGRNDRWRQRQWVPRLNHHPWRRRIAEAKLLVSGLEARWDSRR